MLFYKKLGRRIKVLRERAGLTQEKLAEESGISLDYMGKIEVSINKPGLKTILKLADALKIEPFELLKFDTSDEDCKDGEEDKTKKGRQKRKKKEDKP